MNLKVRAAIYLSLAAGIWGGQYAFSSWVLGSGLIGPFTLLALRLAVTSLILGAIMRATRGSAALILRRDEWGEVLRIGIVGYVVSLGAQFVGTKLSGSAYGSLMTSTSPAFIVVFARLLLGQRVSPLRMGAVGLATLGAVAIVVPNLVGADSGGSPPGTCCSGCGSHMGPVYGAVEEVLSSPRRPGSHLLGQCSRGSRELAHRVAGASACARTRVARPGVGGLVYICVISTAVAFYLWNLGFELMNADAASAFFFMQPVVGATLGWWLLGEPLGPWFFIGAALIGLGLAASAMSPEPRVSLKRGRGDQPAGRFGVTSTYPRVARTSPPALDHRRSRRFSAGSTYLQLRALWYRRAPEPPRSARRSAPRSRVNDPPEGQSPARATHPWVGWGGQGDRRLLPGALAGALSD